MGSSGSVCLRPVAADRTPFPGSIGRGNMAVSHGHAKKIARADFRGVDLGQLPGSQCPFYCIETDGTFPEAAMNRKTRRLLGAVLIVSGGLLLWLTTATTTGLVLLAAAVILEIAGITLEHRKDR
jgi:hypothetical protein